MIKIGQHFAIGPECRIKVPIDCSHRPTNDERQYYYRHIDLSTESARFITALLHRCLFAYPKPYNAMVLCIKHSIVTILLPMRKAVRQWVVIVASLIICLPCRRHLGIIGILIVAKCAIVRDIQSHGIGNAF